MEMASKTKNESANSCVVIQYQLYSAAAQNTMNRKLHEESDMVVENKDLRLRTSPKARPAVFLFPSPPKFGPSASTPELSPLKSLLESHALNLGYSVIAYQHPRQCVYSFCSQRLSLSRSIRFSSIAFYIYPTSATLNLLFQDWLIF